MKPTHNVLDKFFKMYGYEFIDYLLYEFGYNDHVKEVLSNEVIKEFTERRMDYVVITDKNRIINFEFQSTALRPKTIRRFAQYAYILNDQYELDVITIIVSTFHKKNDTKVYRVQEYAYHPIYVYSLKVQDGDKIFNEIKEKHKNNKKLTDFDIARLALIPFYKSEYSIEEVFFNVINLVVSLKLGEEHLLFLRGSLSELSKYFIKDGKLYDEFEEELNVKLGKFDKYILEKSSEYIEESKLEGKLEGKLIGIEECISECFGKSDIEVAKYLLKNNFTKEQIINFTNISEDQFITLLKN